MDFLPTRHDLVLHSDIEVQELLNKSCDQVSVVEIVTQSNMVQTDPDHTEADNEDDLSRLGRGDDGHFWEAGCCLLVNERKGERTKSELRIPGLSGLTMYRPPIRRTGRSLEVFRRPNPILSNSNCWK